MAQEIIHNGETGLVVREKLNSNFTELYNSSGTITADEKSNIGKLTFDPDNPLFSSKIWQAFELDNISLDGTDTDAVMEMLDKAGSGDRFQAASAATAPTLSGKSIVFDGIDDRLLHSNPSAIPHSTSGEIMAIVYIDPAQGAEQVVAMIGKSGGTSDRRNYIQCYFDSTGRPRLGYSETNNGTTDMILVKWDNVIVKGWHVVSWTGDGNEWTLHVDAIQHEVAIGIGSNLGTWVGGLVAPETIDTISIGYRFNQYRGPIIRGVYFFQEKLTDDERTRYVRFLKKAHDLDPFFGLNFCSYGDSLVGTNKFQLLVCERLGMKPINRGIGGTQVKETGSTAYVDADGNTLTGNPPSGTEGVDYFQILSSMSNQERIDTIPEDSDIILILGGANDGSAAGAISDPVDENLNTSFYAAYKTMLDRIQARCPNAKIILVTPPHHATADENFVAGSGYDTLRVAIREIGYMYSFPVIDLKANAQINQNNFATYLSDQVHPNDEGGKVIASVVAFELNVLKPFI
jgi:lysophospholipase L1-like esterase